MNVIPSLELITDGEKEVEQQSMKPEGRRLRSRSVSINSSSGTPTKSPTLFINLDDVETPTKTKYTKTRSSVAKRRFSENLNSNEEAHSATGGRRQRSSSSCCTFLKADTSFVAQQVTTSTSQEQASTVDVDVHVIYGTTSSCLLNVNKQKVMASSKRKKKSHNTDSMVTSTEPGCSDTAAVDQRTFVVPETPPKKVKNPKIKIEKLKTLKNARGKLELNSPNEKINRRVVSKRLAKKTTNNETTSRSTQTEITIKLPCPSFMDIGECPIQIMCPYLHSEFPCKYFCMGLSCPNGDTCQFQHNSELNDSMKNALRYHIMQLLLQPSENGELDFIQQINKDEVFKFLNIFNNETSFDQPFHLAMKDQEEIIKKLTVESTTQHELSESQELAFLTPHQRKLLYDYRITTRDRLMCLSLKQLHDLNIIHGNYVFDLIETINRNKENERAQHMVHESHSTIVSEEVIEIDDEDSRLIIDENGAEIHSLPEATGNNNIEPDSLGEGCHLIREFDAKNPEIPQVKDDTIIKNDTITATNHTLNNDCIVLHEDNSKMTEDQIVTSDNIGTPFDIANEAVDDFTEQDERVLVVSPIPREKENCNNNDKDFMADSVEVVSNEFNNSVNYKNEKTMPNSSEKDEPLVDCVLSPCEQETIDEFIVPRLQEETEDLHEDVASPPYENISQSTESALQTDVCNVTPIGNGRCRLRSDPRIKSLAAPHSQPSDESKPFLSVDYKPRKIKIHKRKDHQANDNRKSDCEKDLEETNSKEIIVIKDANENSLQVELKNAADNVEAMMSALYNDEVQNDDNVTTEYSIQEDLSSDVDSNDLTIHKITQTTKGRGKNERSKIVTVKMTAGLPKIKRLKSTKNITITKANVKRRVSFDIHTDTTGKTQKQIIVTNNKCQRGKKRVGPTNDNVDDTCVTTPEKIKKIGSPNNSETKQNKSINNENEDFDNISTTDYNSSSDERQQSKSKLQHGQYHKSQKQSCQSTETDEENLCLQNEENKKSRNTVTSNKEDEHKQHGSTSSKSNNKSCYEVNLRSSEHVIDNKQGPLQGKNVHLITSEGAIVKYDAASSNENIEPENDNVEYYKYSTVYAKISSKKMPKLQVDFEKPPHNVTPIASPTYDNFETIASPSPVRSDDTRGLLVATTDYLCEEIDARLTFPYMPYILYEVDLSGLTVNKPNNIDKLVKTIYLDPRIFRRDTKAVGGNIIHHHQTQPQAASSISYEQPITTTPSAPFYPTISHNDPRNRTVHQANSIHAQKSMVSYNSNPSLSSAPAPTLGVMQPYMPTSSPSTIDMVTTQIKTPNMILYESIQSSTWYHNLASSQKMQVNQTVTHLISALNSFQRERRLYPTLVFDIFKLENAIELLDIMKNLGLAIDMDGNIIKQQVVVPSFTDDSCQAKRPTPQPCNATYSFIQQVLAPSAQCPSMSRMCNSHVHEPFLSCYVQTPKPAVPTCCGHKHQHQEEPVQQCAAEQPSSDDNNNDNRRFGGNNNNNQFRRPYNQNPSQKPYNNNPRYNNPRFVKPSYGGGAGGDSNSPNETTSPQSQYNGGGYGGGGGRFNRRGQYNNNSSGGGSEGDSWSSSFNNSSTNSFNNNRKLNRNNFHKNSNFENNNNTSPGRSNSSSGGGGFDNDSKCVSPPPRTPPRSSSPRPPISTSPVLSSPVKQKPQVSTDEECWD